MSLHKISLGRRLVSSTGNGIAARDLKTAHDITAPHCLGPSRERRENKQSEHFPERMAVCKAYADKQRELWGPRQEKQRV